MVKKFLKTAPVRVLFEHVKAIIPDTQTQPFDVAASVEGLRCHRRMFSCSIPSYHDVSISPQLHFQRDPLGDKLDLTLADANLLGAAINVHFK